MFSSLLSRRFLSQVEEQERALPVADARYGLFFVFVVLSLSINDVLVLFANFFGVNVQAAAFNWFSSLLYFVLTFIFMMRLGLQYSDFGFTFNNSKKSIIEGFALSGMLIILFAGILFTGHIFLKWPLNFVGRGLRDTLGASSLLYFAHAVLQEVGFRGLYLGSLYRFMHKMHPFLVIVLSSLVFGVLHAHFGLYGFLAAFFGGMLFGYLYLRHQNLCGAIILHFFLGLILFNFILPALA